MAPNLIMVWILQDKEIESEIYLIGSTGKLCVPDECRQSYGIIGLRYDPLAHLECLTCPHYPTNCSHVKYLQALHLNEEMPEAVLDILQTVGKSKESSGTSYSSELKPRSSKPIPFDVPVSHQILFKNGHTFNRDELGQIILSPDKICPNCESNDMTDIHVNVPVILNSTVIMAKCKYSLQQISFHKNSIFFIC